MEIVGGMVARTRVLVVVLEHSATQARVALEDGEESRGEPRNEEHLRESYEDVVRGGLVADDAPEEITLGA